MPKGQVTDEELAKGLSGMSALGPLARANRDSPFRDSRSAEVKTVDLLPSPASRSVEEPARKALSESPALEGKETKPRPKRVLPEKPTRAVKDKALQRKADIYSERVTLQMSPEMRDEVDSLARELQRSKSTKEERITANSVMRVAIRHFLEVFELRGSEQVNTEAEFLALVKRRGEE